ncbi:helix-turn-helix transcriptional regulator [Paracoccus lutimaris]|uniref:AraC family transcriptional activator of pobA n=1 Tax=Paracoccus lutimaris TaxID=1490030 RepID=A0A368YM78_9RHOB|nr:AraC family transcriptional regulator [Paracoccus lutimaris]RCW81341.1 AraC family transcriptional activator of pobA [Paracoccus lutimaris]
MNESVRAVNFPATSPADADQLRLIAAAVTAATILEPSVLDPRLAAAARLAGLPEDERSEDEAEDGPGLADGIALLAPHVAMPPAALARASIAVPPFAPGDGLRLIPLSGFHWGGAVRGRNMPPAPRVRGDHVLILLSRGVLQIEFPRHQHLLTMGRVAFIPAGTAFALQPGLQVQGRALLIAPTHARGLPLALPSGFCWGAPAADDQPLIEPAMLALGAAQPRSSAGETATACQLGLIAVALSRLDARAGQRDAVQSGIAEARPLTERFLDLARAELAQSQTIAEMARKLGHSQAHLERACQQSRGRSALELLYDLRLQHAAEALRNTARPIAEIAQDLGYAGLGHFMRSFAAATGRTPETYREIMRGESGNELGGQFS